MFTGYDSFCCFSCRKGTIFDDLAFHQSCKTGFERAKKEFGFETAYNIDTATNNYTQRLEYYGSLNFDLIIAVGYMWNDAVAAASTQGILVTRAYSSLPGMITVRRYPTV